MRVVRVVRIATVSAIGKAEVFTTKEILALVP
jgi:hypothetical protein